MVTLLDSDLLPPSDRRPSQVAARLEAALVSRVRFADPRLPARARLDAWDLGGVPVLRADLSGDLLLARSAHQARRDTAPAVSLAVQQVGVALHDQFGSQRVVRPGGLAMTEVGSAYRYRWSGRGVCRALQVPVSRLEMSVDDVRRALPLAHRSPLHGVLRAHLDQVTGDAEQLAGDPLVHSLVAATIDLTRALLASALGSGRPVTSGMTEPMLTRVRSYVRRHLTDPGLDAGQVAAAHAISVRQLYRLCAAAQFSLEQWTIQQRLEGARGELSDPGSRESSIATVARRWGFTDPSYFSRRFRRAFGVTPRDWRHADTGLPLLPVPRTEADAVPATGWSARTG